MQLLLQMYFRQLIQLSYIWFSSCTGDKIFWELHLLSDRNMLCLEVLVLITPFFATVNWYKSFKSFSINSSLTRTFCVPHFFSVKYLIINDCENQRFGIIYAGQGCGGCSLLNWVMLNPGKQGNLSGCFCSKNIGRIIISIT